MSWVGGFRVCKALGSKDGKQTCLRLLRKLFARINLGFILGQELSNPNFLAVQTP